MMKMLRYMWCQHTPDLSRHQEVAHGAEGTKSRCQRQEAAVIAKSAGRPRKLLIQTRADSESPTCCL